MKEFYRRIGILFGLIPFVSAQPAQAAGDYIVLLHGIGRTKTTMLPLAGYLSFNGYNVINVDYPSRKKPIGELVEDIHKVLEERKLDPSKKVNFVGYSLGGLVIRAYISKHRPANLGSVVMIGTPNQGSEVADFLKDYSLYKKYFGPAGQQLSTDQQDIKDLLGVIDYDLGVIAGRLSIDPVSSLLIIPGSNDGKVSVERTKVNNMKDHIVLNTTHTFMINNPFVMKQVRNFIEHGQFARKTAGG
ncbi:MAG: alpha/beta fold hydrolase [Alphaproteobacteria bacterium]